MRPVRGPSGGVTGKDDERRRWRDRGLQAAGPLCILLLWAGITGLDLVPPLLVTSPQTTFRRLWNLLATADLNADLAATMWRWAAGYLLATVVGAPLGLLMGSSTNLYHASFGILDFFRSLPVTALFPLFLLLFGIGDGSKISMAFAAAAPIIMLNSAYGILHAQKTRVLAAKVFGASRIQIFCWVLFYEALPHTLVGMRTALSLGLIVVIVSEMFIGTQFGLGQRVFDAYTVNLTEDLYALLVLVGLIGYAVNKLFMYLERRIVFWVGR